MLGKASRLAVPALFVSLFNSVPAAAQSQDAATDGAPASCQRTISQEAGAGARGTPADTSACTAPRDRIVHGGWLGRAIMLVDLTSRLAPGRPHRAADQAPPARPVFASPLVTY
jgi:hypothetical protein